MATWASSTRPSTRTFACSDGSGVTILDGHRERGGAETPRRSSVGSSLPLPLCILASPGLQQETQHPVSCVLGFIYHSQKHGICFFHPIPESLGVPASRPFQLVGRSGLSHGHRIAAVSIRSFSQSMEGSSFLSPPTRLSPGPLTGVLISGSGPLAPALPGTELSPAPSQRPSNRCSLLLPLLAGCSWCHRCAGLGRRRGSGSTPAPVARWPRTAARDREGKMRQGHIGSKV